MSGRSVSVPREQIERVVELYQSGLSVPKVGAKTGLGSSRVYSLLLKEGVKMRPRQQRNAASEQRTGIPLGELARLYREGASLEMLAWKAGVSSTTVLRALRALGVEIRPHPKKPVPKLPAEVIAERYRAGESAGALAKEAGVRVVEIREILTELGEVLRPPLGSVYGNLDHPWFTPERIVSLYEEGETVKGLAKTLGVSREMIRTLLLKNGVTLRGRGGGPTPAPDEIVSDPEEVKRRYAAGEGIEMIARAMERTTWGVRTVLLKMGVKLRGPRGMKGDDVIPPPMTAEEVASLYKSGMSVERIGARFGIGSSKIQRMLREQDVKLRTIAEAVAQPETVRRLADAEVVGRYRKGETLERLAMAAGSTVPVIRRVLRDHRVKLRPKEVKLRRSPEEIIALYEAGKSVLGIAAMEGCSNHPIRELLLRSGVRMRSQIEATDRRAAKLLITPEEIEARYRAGESLSQIGAAAGGSLTRVAAILRRRGVKMRGRGAVKKSETEGLKISPDAMEALYREGKTMAQIAALAGSNRRRVGDILKKHGVKIRARQDYETDWTAVAKR